MQDISDCLSPQAQHVAEARLAAKRAARAEAREIRMKELERQQKEVEERPDKDFGDKSSRPVSSLSAATLASLGGTSSRRGSGDTSISVDTEASIREIKDSLTEVEEKYKRSMVTNAQLDNEKTSLQYQVDMMQDVLLELEEELAEARRQYDEKHKECERQKHDQTVLRFQLAEMKDALEQRESLLTKHGIALDSEDMPNGETPLESHVNSDSRPDPPIRVTSMGQLEETLKKKETLSAVGESPPSRNEQDTTQEVLQDASPKTPPPVEARNIMKEQSPKENVSNTDCKVEPSLSDTFSDTVTELEHLKVEQPHDSEFIKDEKEIVTDNCLHENLNKDETEQMFSEEVEATLTQNDVSPSEEIFQDALDDVQSPSAISPLSDESAFSLDDCKTKDHSDNQQKDSISKVKSESSESKANTENALDVPEYKDQNTSDIPANVSDLHTGEEDEHEASSPDSSSKYESGASSTDETIFTDEEEHDQVCEKVNPEEASVEVEPRLQDTEDNPGKTNRSNITDEKSSDGVSEGDIHDDDNNKIGSIPEQSSQVIQDKKEEKHLVELDANTLSEVSESSLSGTSESIFDKAGKDYINLRDGHQEKNEDTTDDGSLHIVPKEKECEKAENLPPDTADTVFLDQAKEDKLSDSLTHAESQNPIDSDTLKTSPIESLSSEDESAPEGEESDDEDDNEDGAVRSEKYTGESLPLGSSVDRSSMDDIRMEDSSDKALKKGKGKNKEDCVVS